MNRRQFLHASTTAMAAGAWFAASRAGRARAAEPPAPGSRRPVPEDALAGPARGPWRRLLLDASAVEAQADSVRTMDVQLAWS